MSVTKATQQVPYLSGLALRNSLWLICGANLQPTGKLSPATAHCGWLFHLRNGRVKSSTYKACTQSLFTTTSKTSPLPRSPQDHQHSVVNWLQDKRMSC